MYSRQGTVLYSSTFSLRSNKRVVGDRISTHQLRLRGFERGVHEWTAVNSQVRLAHIARGDADEGVAGERLAPVTLQVVRQKANGVGRDPVVTPIRARHHERFAVDQLVAPLQARDPLVEFRLAQPNARQLRLAVTTSIAPAPAW